MLNTQMKLPVSPITCSRRNFVNKTFIFYTQDALIIVHIEIKEHSPQTPLCTTNCTIQNGGCDESIPMSHFLSSQGTKIHLFAFSSQWMKPLLFFIRGTAVNTFQRSLFSSLWMSKTTLSCTK